MQNPSNASGKTDPTNKVLSIVDRLLQEAATRARWAGTSNDFLVYVAAASILLAALQEVRPLGPDFLATVHLRLELLKLLEEGLVTPDQLPRRRQEDAAPTGSTSQNRPDKAVPPSFSEAPEILGHVESHGGAL